MVPVACRFFCVAFPRSRSLAPSTPIVSARSSMLIVLVRIFIVRNYVIWHSLRVKPSLCNTMIARSPLPLLGEFLRASITWLLVMVA